VGTLRCVQAIVKMQALVRARYARLSLEGSCPEKKLDGKHEDDNENSKTWVMLLNFHPVCYGTSGVDDTNFVFPCHIGLTTIGFMPSINLKQPHFVKMLRCYDNNISYCQLSKKENVKEDSVSNSACLL
jgi:hypothetical protein